MAPRVVVNEHSESGRPAPPGDRFDRNFLTAASVAAVLLFAPLFIPLFTGRIFALDDLSAFHLPMRHLYQQALTEGHSLLWTSQLFSGFYVHAEGQIGAYHPLHLLLYSALPLTLAFNLELVLSYVFAFAGMWCFLRHVGFLAGSSLVGATAFAFSGFALLHLPHMNAVAVIAHIPWLLLAIDLSISHAIATRLKGLAGIALLLGSQTLLGYPQYIWMTALIGLVFGAICGRALFSRLVVAGLASLVGLMLGGIQLVPSFDLLTNSVRRTVGADFALSYSLHPLNVLQLFSPYLLLHRIYAVPQERFLHEFGLYSGALATIAIAWALLRRRHLPFGQLAIFAGTLCITGLLLALGRYVPLYEWLTAAPLVGKFRAPSRHIIVVHVGLAILVAILVEDVRRLSATKSAGPLHLKWVWIPALASASVAGVALLWPQIWATLPDQHILPAGVVLSTAIVIATTLLVTDAARGSRAAVLLVPCLFAVDLGLWGYSYAFSSGLKTVTEMSDGVGPPPASAGATVHQQARTRDLNHLLLHGLRVLRPYVGLPPARHLTLSTIDELRVSGAEWVSTGDSWAAVPDPMPRFRFVPEWTVIHEMSGLPAIDIRRTAVVAEPLPTISPTSGGVLDVIADEPGRLVIDVSTKGPTLLSTTEAYDPGWRASGGTDEPLRTVALYGDYLGVIVQPGTYRITLAFEPTSVRAGRNISITGLIVVLILTVAFLAKGEQQATSPVPAVNPQ